MSVRIFVLRDVPDDEADEVRELLERHGFDYYETPPGIWGVSSAALWLRDDHRAEEARALLDRYQTERARRVRAEYAQLRRAGQAPGVLDELRKHPLRFIVYVTFAAGVLYFSLKPFVDFGR